jgi:WhiB family transcriptional regulator, redox-sensing transcriptional regulator
MATDGLGAWWDLAACQAADPDLFFPITRVGVAAIETSRAKAICARCAIRRRCLDYALASGERHGIWGGTTEDERRVIAAQSWRGRFADQPHAARDSPPHGRATLSDAT